MPVIREFVLGVSLFVRGFAMWLRSPGLMLLGAVPGLVVGVVFLAALIVLGINAGALAEWMTPFAREWDDGWRDSLRILLAVAIVAAGVAVGVMTFAAVTLAVAAPFTDRISALVDARLGGPANAVDEPFWAAIRRGIGDGMRLLGSALASGLVVFLVGLIPVVGGLLGWTTGAILGGRALAIELTGTPGDARGIPLAHREKLLAGRRALSLGFGVCAYVMFLVPGGAVLGTPAAVAGGTLLLRELVGEPTRRHRPDHPGTVSGTNDRPRASGNR